MNSRLKSHNLKMKHLDLIFERELFHMQAYYSKNYKSKSNK